MKVLQRVLIATMLIVSIGCADKRTLPGIVVGNSMAPTMLGDHCQANCYDCGIRFAFETPSLPAVNHSRRIVCPNCGFTAPESSAAIIQRANPVTIDPTSAIERWEIVAFQLPNGKGAGIKRVVGLPGETITIQAGDLFANGNILRKPWHIQRQLRIPVYDSHFQPSSTKTSRWRPSADESSWRLKSGRWNFQGCNDKTGGDKTDSNESEKNDGHRPASSWDALVYHHWRCCAHTGKRDQDFPIEDVDSFNIAVGRNLNPTDDLFLEIVLDAGPDSCFGWRFSRGEIGYKFEIDVAKQLLVVNTTCRQQTSSSRELKLPSEISFHAATIEFSTFDSQLLLRINRQHVFAQATNANPLIATDSTNGTLNLLAARSRNETVDHPLEIGALTGDIQINRVRLWRDIHYLPPVGTQRQVLKATADQFILLGDNAPVSIDSRTWREPGIDRDAIIGTVLVK